MRKIMPNVKAHLSAAILVIPFLLTAKTQADGVNKRDQLMDAIRTSSCNTIENKDLSIGVKADEEILIEAAKKQCLAFIITPMLPTEKSSNDDRRTFFKAVDSAETKYLDYLKTEFIPRGKGKFDYYHRPWTYNEEIGVGRDLGVFEGLSKSACNATKLLELRTSDVCKRLSSIRSMFDELTKIHNEQNSTERQKQICYASPTKDCVHKIMVKQFTRPEKEWLWHDSYSYHLNQISEGYAIFVDLDNPNNDLVAFERSTLRNTTHPLTKGDNLATALLGTGCAKFLSEGEAETLDGFGKHVYRYQAVQCPTPRTISSSSK